MTERPTQVWVLHEGTREPVLLSNDQVAAGFIQYPDTGWEPILGWLYEQVSCTCIDRRVLPGLGALWFDDNGRMRKRRHNPVASALYEYCYRTGEGVVGTAVLVVDPKISAVSAKDVETSIAYTYRRISEQLLQLN